jgi:hypothetical protein
MKLVNFPLATAQNPPAQAEETSCFLNSGYTYVCKMRLIIAKANLTHPRTTPTAEKLFYILWLQIKSSHMIVLLRSFYIRKVG